MVTPTRCSGRLRDSIGFKLASATVLILVIATSVSAYIQVELARDDLFERKEQATMRVAEQLVLALTAPLEFDDDLAVAEAIAGISADAELVSMRVLDGARSVPTGAVGPEPPSQLMALAAPRLHWGDDVLWISWPIRDVPADVDGTLVMGLSSAAERAVWTGQRDLILLMTLGSALVLAVSLVAASRKMVVQPLLRLATAAEAFGRGDPVTAPVLGSDEVGRLGSSFAAMMAAIGMRERKIAAAQAEVVRLLDAMRQAVFGFGPDLRVVGRCSRAAHAVFGRDDLERVDVRELLLAGLAEGSPEASAIAEFLELVFVVPAAAWPQVQELAPREICLHPDTPEQRELVLEFVPLREGDALARVMVVVTDETEARRIRREMKALEDRYASDLAATRRLLCLGANVFVDFSASMHRRLACVDALVAAPSRAGVEEVLRKVHAVRGDARALGMVELARALGAAEAVVAEARDSVDPPPASQWTAALRGHLEIAESELERARGRLVAASDLGEEVLQQVTVSARDLDMLGELRVHANGPLARCIDRLRARMLGAVLVGLEDAVGAWAASEGKRVRLEIVGATVRIAPDVAMPLRTAIVQLVRNSIAHGIEAPPGREAAGKAAVGTVRIAAVASGDDEGLPTVEVFDDGAGIDFAALAMGAALRGAAVEPGALPFVDGVSTRARADSLAGRGVGLSAVQEALGGIGYVLEVDSEPGGGTRMRLVPMRAPLRVIESG